MRVSVNALFRLREADAGQHLDSLDAGLRFVHLLVKDEGFRDLVANRVNGAERSHRFLKDDGDFIAPDVADFHAPRVELGELDPFRRAVPLVAIEKDMALDDLSWWGNNPHNGLRGDTLTTTAFPDDTQGPAALDVKADALDSVDGAFVQVEVDFEVLHFDQGLSAVWVHLCPSSAIWRRGLPHRAGRRPGN